MSLLICYLFFIQAPLEATEQTMQKLEMGASTVDPTGPVVIRSVGGVYSRQSGYFLFISFAYIV